MSGWTGGGVSREGGWRLYGLVLSCYVFFTGRECVSVSYVCFLYPL